MHKGRSVVECGEYKVIDCSECGFKHLDPIPSEEELGRYYKERYFQEEIPKLLSPEKEARESEWSELWHRDRLLTFNRYALGETRSLLDVGCGNGFFADFMRRNYWEVTCVEPSEKAYLHAKELGLNVFKGTFENFVEEKRTGSFDAINLKSVLEHMPDPAGTLENCKSLLKREGIMCVYIPNDFNSFQLRAHRSGRRRWWVDSPGHINYFNFKDLRGLLKRTGFDIISETTDFPMEIFLLLGKNYVDDDTVGKACHDLRMKLEMSVPGWFRRGAYSALAKFGMGRSCMIYARPTGAV